MHASAGRSAFRVLLAAGVLISCESATGPQPFRGSFSLTTLQGKTLPLPDGSSLLIGDSLRFDEARRPHDESPPRILATVVHRRDDGTEEVVQGFQSYQRRGDTVITSFACRFSDICLTIVVPPELGVLRNDSLIFSPARPTGPSRIYRRVR